VSVDRSKASECGTKQRNATKQEALGQLTALARRGANFHRLSAYHCKHCGAWHVGHRPKPKRNR
jgi:hypothetical protein